MSSKVLYVIPARGGSKGVPGKNIKKLNGKPLICYTIDLARALVSDEDICVSTDDDNIIKVVESYGLNVPFKRPVYLGTDTATTNDVLLHAIEYYESIGVFYDTVVLLQPTSPFRTISQLKEILDIYNNKMDMVVSVKESESASVICVENKDGYLEFALNKDGARRQDVSSFYEYNGAFYIINVTRLKDLGLKGLTRKKKYIMDDITSHDIDTILDWLVAESIIKEYFQ